MTNSSNWYVLTIEETVEQIVEYIVQAESEEDARRKFEEGEAQYDGTVDTIEVENSSILSVRMLHNSQEEDKDA